MTCGMVFKRQQRVHGLQRSGQRFPVESGLQLENRAIEFVSSSTGRVLRQQARGGGGHRTTPNHILKGGNLSLIVDSGLNPDLVSAEGIEGLAALGGVIKIATVSLVPRQLEQS